jgi:hypothetical protein
MFRRPGPSLGRFSFVFAAACLLLDAANLAASVIPLPSDFLVNSYTTGLQGYPSVAIDADGDFVVAWTSYAAQDGSDRGVFARRFNAAGIAQAAEFQVNSYTVGPQAIPSVSLADAGQFVIAWTGYGGQDGSNNGIFARRFSAAGVPQAVEFQVNSFTTGYQLSADLSLDADGDFVVAWTSFSTSQDGSGDGVFARRFSSAGVPQASEFQVNSFTPGDQTSPSVSLDANGDFVIALTGEDSQDGSNHGVFARRFDAAGVPQAAEFQVNSFTPGDQSSASVSLDADGDFVVAWDSQLQDGSDQGVFARRFNAAGVPLAVEFQVNTYTTGLQFGFSAGLGFVSLDADGDFVVSWQSQGQDGSSDGVFVRRFNSSGAPLTTELQVNSYTTNSQRSAAVAADDSGDFVVAWHGYGHDDVDNGIFARTFNAPAVLDIDGNGITAPLSDGLLVLRFLFGFTGAPLVSGAVEAGCTRCDAPAIEAYLGGLI